MFATLTIDIGSNLLSLLGPVAVAAAVWFQGYKNSKTQAEITANQAQTAKEFSTNGGSTMRDAIDRIERNVASTDARLGQMETRLSVVEHPVQNPGA